MIARDKPMNEHSESRTQEKTLYKIEGQGAAPAAAPAPRFDYSRIPQEMRTVNNWICWKAKPDPNSHSGIKKIPVNPRTGGNACMDKPVTWGSFENALAAVDRFRLAGIGFVFAGSGFFGIDIDDMPLDSDEVREIVNAMQTYTERSQSGNGLHLIARGSLPGKDMRKGKIEMYAKNRFFVMTGNQIGEQGIRDCTEAVKPIYERYAPKQQPEPPAPQPLPVSSMPEPAAAPGAALTDNQIIELANGSASGTKFRALWHGDTSQYDGDESRADAALCCMLAFYTKDAAQIDRLFRSSGLMRAKWDRKTSGSTYGRITIEKAIATTTETYTPKRGRGRPPKSPQAGAASSSSQTAETAAPKQSTPLTIEMLDEFLAGHDIRCRFNEITHRIVYDGIPAEYDGERAQALAPTVICSMLKAENIKGSAIQTVTEYLSAISAKHRYNPVRERLDAVTWDGQSRIAALFDIMRIPEEDELSRRLIVKFLMQALCLACLNEYGAHYGADGVLVLTGAQGIGKTSLAQRLGINSELFKAGLAIDPRDKDSILKATSCFIGEIGELETTMKRDIPALKSFITDREDEVRPPYGRSSERYIRRTSYIATCNSSDFLLDTTGNRRFWTIPCNQPFDLDALARLDVMQLWAEIYDTVRKAEDPSKVFRLTAEERERLDERNGRHLALIPAQAEILDILEKARQNPESYKRQYMTVADWIGYYSDILRRYDARQIGKALDVCKVESKRIKRNGEVSRMRELPIPDRHFDSIGYAEK